MIALGGVTTIECFYSYISTWTQVRCPLFCRRVRSNAGSEDFPRYTALRPQQRRESLPASEDRLKSAITALFFCNDPNPKLLGYPSDSEQRAISLVHLSQQDCMLVRGCKMTRLVSCLFNTCMDSCLSGTVLHRPASATEHHISG